MVKRFRSITSTIIILLILIPVVAEKIHRHLHADANQVEHTDCAKCFVCNYQSNFSFTHSSKPFILQPDLYSIGILSYTQLQPFFSTIHFIPLPRSPPVHTELF